MTDKQEASKIGIVTHYYTKLSVGIIKLEKDIKLGDNLHFKGFTTDFKQVLDDMQFEHKQVEEGKKGQEVGIKVTKKVRDGDEVYLA